MLGRGREPQVQRGRGGGKKVVTVPLSTTGVETRKSPGQGGDFVEAGEAEVLAQEGW